MNSTQLNYFMSYSFQCFGSVFIEPVSGSRRQLNPDPDPDLKII